MKNRSGEKIKLASIDELLGVVNEESAMEDVYKRQAPVRMTVPSSTSFLSADSTEELPRLGQATNASFFENFPSVFSEYVFTISYIFII